MNDRLQLGQPNFILPLFVISLAVALTGCGSGGESNSPGRPDPAELSAGLIESVALPDRGDAEPGTLFERLPASRTGIDFVHRWDPPRELEELITSQMAGGGVAIGDYDGDGRADVFLTRPQGGCRLYRNLGDFRFADVTVSAGLEDESLWGMGPTFADFDNDGDLDLFVCVYAGPNRLYINQGDGTFREEAARRGLDFSGASIMLAPADYDSDGDLDFYLLTNRAQPPADMKAYFEYLPDGTPTTPEKFRQFFDVMVRPDGKVQEFAAGQYDHLYRNNGDGTFTDVSREAGIEGNHYGLSATWWDYDDDGHPDLYVANDFFGPDLLYHNRGDGTFDEVAKDAFGHTPWYSMGSDAADINNDGLIDFFASDMSSTTHHKSKLLMGEMGQSGWFLDYGQPRQTMRNALYLNTGVGRFMEAAFMAGLSKTDWTWSVKLADLDGDGWVDLFVSNGMTRYWFNSDLRARWGDRWDEDARAAWLGSPRQAEANLAFRNMGGVQFKNVGAKWGLDAVGVSFGAALGDLDGDGDLDIVTNDFERPPGVYRNRSAANHRLKIRLKGTASNRYGIGAKLLADTAAGLQVRHLTIARGFMAADEPIVNFGLGEEASVRRLTVRWPSGHVQTFDNLPADRFYTITEPSGLPPERKPAPLPPGMFERNDFLLAARHRERPYDDFKRQPLLPNKLSQLGPGMAWGDVDGDGDDDFYLGAAAGDAGVIRLNQGGWFSEADGSAATFEPDRDAEDMGAVFFDADGDGDLDLYVVSGGVECDADDERLRDRLYLNDGQGRFVRAPADALPDVRDSGGVVIAADVDRDGDLDLFIGGRVIPGQYPLAPNSRLLINQGGRFTDATDRLAPGLRRSGLVTSALWSDVDDDGWIDLLVTHEWGPVKLFHNERGKLVDRTDRAGLSDRLGWWNGIAGGDVDGDGDIDYVVTNFGLNTKYHASSERPTLLYYGDFEGSGKKKLVEAEFEYETLFPIRGKSCSTRAMPHLKERFGSFRDFALADLSAIYTPKCLGDAQRFAANTLESGVLLNDGKGRFSFAPLPRLAQISPAFGVVVGDFSGDGNADIYLVQNFFSPQIETGRMDGGLSLLLMGRGDGSFRPVWPRESGLVVPGDAKSLAVTDLDGDGRPDFAVGVNNGRSIAMKYRSGQPGRFLTVRLSGVPGNPTAVGARVTVLMKDGAPQTAEVHAGGGYLSQSTHVLYFGLGEHGQPERIVVRWPDGSESSLNTVGDRASVEIKQPR